MNTIDALLSTYRCVNSETSRYAAYSYFNPPSSLIYFFVFPPPVFASRYLHSAP
ncbi:hypothetical protein FA13DRAFT_1730295, partial [Coprinellus micaceus]